MDEVEVVFVLDRETQFGENLFVIGSIPQLGEWDVARALPLQYMQESQWRIAIKVSPCSFEYKYLIQDQFSESMVWESSSNRAKTVSHHTNNMLDDRWDTLDDSFCDDSFCSEESSLPSPVLETCTVSVVLMDEVEFKIKRKKLDFAIFGRSLDDIVAAKEELISQLSATPPSPEIAEQVQELLLKADEVLQHLREVLTSPNSGRRLASGEKKLSVRSQARLSHFRLMSARLDILPIPIKKENVEIIPKEDIEGTVLHVWLDRHKGSIDLQQARTVSDIVELLNEEEQVQLKTIETAVDNEVKKQNNLETASEDIWKYEVHLMDHQGRRTSMEDRIIFMPYINEMFRFDATPEISFLAVYDGHGGDKAAEYARDHLHVNILRNQHFPADIPKAIQEGFLKTDKVFNSGAKQRADKSGSTATIALIVEDVLYVANVGDTSAMICRNGVPTHLTTEHRASVETEKVRIKEAGGLVVWYGGWRVNGTSAVSRSIGDEPLSAFLIAEPSITTYKIEAEDDFLVIASDGLWDVLKEEEVAEIVYKWDPTQQKNVSEALADAAIKLNSQDNITIGVMFLRSAGTGKRRDRASSASRHSAVQ